MARTITISLPHDLSEDEVKRRVITGISDARRKFPEHLKDATELWSGNTLSFAGRAMGQSITGRLEIQPDNVVLTVNLPFVLGLFAAKLRPRIEEEGRKLLSSEVR